MRVAVVATLKAGVERFVYRELQFLAAHGVDLDLCPTKYARGLYNPDPGWRVHPWKLLPLLLAQPWYAVRRPVTYVRLGMEAVRFKVLPDFLMSWHFAQRIGRPDLIYATFGDHKLFVGYFLKRILSCPLTVTFHAHELYQNPNEDFFRHVLPQCDQLVAVTEYNREVLATEFGVDRDRISVSRLSIDLDEYRPAPSRRFVILICAYFNPRKGHEILLRAVQHLARKDIEVWVVGGPGSEDPVDVAGLARELGIEDQVILFGPVGGAALNALFHSCDVFCLPSRIDERGLREGFPTVIIEAMAMGKPVISTRHVEIPRVLPELLVDENDVEGLAEAIESAYNDPDLLARLGKQNRGLAETTFSNDNSHQKLALFRSLLPR